MECVKRLLVADASQEFRCHLVESFQNEPDMEVVGETGDGLQLLELTQKLLHPSHQVEKEYLVWVTGDVSRGLPVLSGPMIWTACRCPRPRCGGGGPAEE